MQEKLTYYDVAHIVPGTLVLVVLALMSGEAGGGAADGRLPEES
jgi:hypothetical protein